MTDKLPSDPWKNPQFVKNGAAEELSRMLTLGNELRRKCVAGYALGTFVLDCPVAGTLNVLALAGFDFIVVDMEHSSVGISRLESLIVVGQAVGVPILVRPWSNQAGLIGKILDMGANGIMAPHVNSAGQAAAIVEQARFAPRGNRGFSPLTKYDAITEPLRALGESTFVVVQIEGRQAIEKVPEIASVPGIDAIFVGPYDLALSMRVSPGSAEVIAAAEQLAQQVPPEVVLGIYIDDATKSRQWAARRFALQCVSFDARMMSDGARAVVAQARTGKRIDIEARD